MVICVFIMINSRCARRVIGLFLLMLMVLPIAAQDQLVFERGSDLMAITVNKVDSVKVEKGGTFLLWLNGTTDAVMIDAMRAYYHRALPDTLLITFAPDKVTVCNPRMDQLSVECDGFNVSVTATGKRPFVCLTRGRCDDGQLTIAGDTMFTVVLDGLELTSQHDTPLKFVGKQQVAIELPQGSMSRLENCAATIPQTNSKSSSCCIYSKGDMAFRGEGCLMVTDNCRYGIYSAGSITIDDANLIVSNTIKDGVHCSDLNFNSGSIALTVNNDAAKGIKTTHSLAVNGGAITGTAAGNVVIDAGETTYCTLVKVGADFSMTGGALHLVNSGRGGRCISVDGNAVFAGGNVTLETGGDGGEYINALNEPDYYSPKCITVDGDLHIEQGEVNATSQGMGGKGIDCSGSVCVGKQGDDFLHDGSLTVTVETRGDAVAHSEVEDFRHGCPKAIKASGDVYLYSGRISLRTSGIGGEGLESKTQARIYNAQVEAVTFDDGINVGQHLVVDGGHVYCFSTHNDGIDSNGKITIKNGVVASISVHAQDESFDTDPDGFFVYGGIVFGVGRGRVSVGEADQPYYSTPMQASSLPISLAGGRYLSVCDGDAALLSLLVPEKVANAVVTVSAPSFVDGASLRLIEAEHLEGTTEQYFHDAMLVGGSPLGCTPIIDINVNQQNVY